MSRDAAGFAFRSDATLSARLLLAIAVLRANPPAVRSLWIGDYGHAFALRLEHEVGDLLRELTPL